MRKVFRALAGGQDDGPVLQPGSAETLLESGEMQSCHALVGHHHDRAAFGERRQMDAGARDQSAADVDLIAPRAELDTNDARLAHRAVSRAAGRAGRCFSSADMTRSRVASGGPSTVSTVMSASA